MSQRKERSTTASLQPLYAAKQHYALIYLSKHAWMYLYYSSGPDESLVCFFVFFFPPWFLKNLDNTFHTSNPLCIEKYFTMYMIALPGEMTFLLRNPQSFEDDWFY